MKPVLYLAGKNTTASGTFRAAPRERTAGRRAEGPCDRLNAGVGRNSFEKTFDGFVKYKILRQQHAGERAGERGREAGCSGQVLRDQFGERLPRHGICGADEEDRAVGGLLRALDVPTPTYLVALYIGRYTRRDVELGGVRGAILYPRAIESRVRTPVMTMFL